MSGNTGFYLEASLSGALETLLPYETERQRRVIPIISAINALNSLFSSTLTPVIIARGLGLQAADVMSPIKVCDVIC